MQVSELVTPALVVEAKTLDDNLRTMAKSLPGSRLRPHVKAHKCTELAKRQAELGSRSFTCATVREMEGMAAAGLGDDLLLANEVVDARRLGALDARVTVAVDSIETIEAAAVGGVREVMIDVNVGLPRCGCQPDDAGRLADLARKQGLEVRGVMGYEGHLMMVEGVVDRTARVAESMAELVRAHAAVGGDIISAGGTGTFDCNHAATEIQAGSYALMDTAYDQLGLPFEPALFLVATVVSVSEKFAVADCGLKSLGMDHGNPRIEGAKVWFCSDEHVTFSRDSSSASADTSQPGSIASPVRVGDRIRVVPAHVDPTIAYHEAVHIVSGDEVLDSWPVDLRGW